MSMNQNPLQNCKVISLQLIKINEKKKTQHLDQGSTEKQDPINALLKEGAPKTLSVRNY